jgi:hypothetical protein
VLGLSHSLSVVNANRALLAVSLGDNLAVVLLGRDAQCVRHVLRVVDTGTNCKSNFRFTPERVNKKPVQNRIFGPARFFGLIPVQVILI